MLISMKNNVFILIKMKPVKKMFFGLFLLCGINCIQAQQAPTKAKTTKAAPAKSASAKKPTKTSKKPAMVFMCEGTNGYTYHSRRTCAKLAKCNGKITELSKADAVNGFGKEPCKNCN